MMKFLHLSDLHLGKRVNEFSMIEDQEYILTKILHIVDEEKPDGIFLAGDIYDKSVPSEDAIKLLNHSLLRLAKRKVETFLISGNHDSAVKRSFASDLIDLSGIHISPVYCGEIHPFHMEKGKDKVNIFMLPFIKPSIVKAVFPDEAEAIHDYTDACRVAISHIPTKEAETNILIAHQFVTGATRSESEEISVGGLDNVDADVFDSFQYVALGHIHGPQKIGRETIRYSGTPLKYSFSEVNHKKSVSVIEIEKKEINVRTIDLIPLRDMREITGTFDEIVSKDFYQDTPTDDYLHVILKDEDDIPDAMGKLRVIYPNIMKVTYDNKRTRENRELSEVVDVETKSPFTLFSEFYEAQNNQPMNHEQKEFLISLMDTIWKESK